MALAEAQVMATIYGAAGLVGLFILLLWAVSFAIVGILAKVADVKRRREDEAACLQERLATALGNHPSLAALPLKPMAHVPILRGTPATIVLYGQVPASELRDRVVSATAQELSRVRSDFRIQDRIAVIPWWAPRPA